MIKFIRKIISICFLVLGALNFAIAEVFMTKEHRDKLDVVLEDVLSNLKSMEEDFEPETIEDILFKDLVDLTQKDYHKGTNEDLTVECRMCGENTKRGKYYARNNDEPDSTLAYMFICPKCYRRLPNE